MTSPARRTPRYPPKPCRACNEPFDPWGSSVVRCLDCTGRHYADQGHCVVAIKLLNSHPVVTCECAEAECSASTSMPPAALRDPANTPWRCALCRRRSRGRRTVTATRACDRCKAGFVPRGARSRRCDACIISAFRDDGHDVVRILEPLKVGRAIRIECRCPNCSTLEPVAMSSLSRATDPWWCRDCVARRPKQCDECEEMFAPRGRSATVCDQCLLVAARARRHDALSVESNEQGHAVIRCRCRDCPTEKRVGVGQLRRYFAWRCPKCSHADPDYRRRLEEARRRHGRPTAFYVVSGGGILKVGLADGDGERRLAMHVRQGLSRREGVWFLRDGGQMPQIEQDACWLIFRHGPRCTKTDLPDGYSEAIWCDDPASVTEEIADMMALVCPDAVRR